MDLEFVPCFRRFGAHPPKPPGFPDYDEGAFLARRPGADAGRLVSSCEVMQIPARQLFEANPRPIAQTAQAGRSR